MANIPYLLQLSNHHLFNEAEAADPVIVKAQFHPNPSRPPLCHLPKVFTSLHSGVESPVLSAERKVS